MSNLVNLLSLATFTVMLSLGQLLFKRVGLSIQGQSASDAVVSAIKDPALIAALMLYGLATVLWIWILSRVPLMQAYPWVAAGIVIVPMLGWLVFGERVSWIFWIGVALIVAGIIVTQFAVEQA